MSPAKATASAASATPYCTYACCEGAGTEVCSVWGGASSASALRSQNAEKPSAIPAATNAAVSRGGFTGWKHTAPPRPPRTRRRTRTLTGRGRFAYSGPRAMEIYLDKRAVKQIRLSAQDAIEEGDIETLREDILEAFTEEQVEEIERRLDNGDFFEFLTDLLDEWSGDDADELMELIDTQLGDVGVDLKFEKRAAGAEAEEEEEESTDYEDEEFDEDEDEDLDEDEDEDEEDEEEDKERE